MSALAPTYAEFIERFPAFAAAPPEQVQFNLDMAVRLLDAPTWGDFFSDAVSLDAAHNLFLYQQACSSPQGAAQGTAGPVSNVSAAGVSIGFTSPQWNTKSMAQNWYMKTIYGQQLLRLWDAVVPMGVMCA